MSNDLRSSITGGGRAWTDQNAPGARPSSAHQAIEVFPAPTWIELFDLPDRIRYKKGPRTARIAALATLHGLLGRLAGVAPPLRSIAIDRVSELMDTARTGREWKAVEDIIDARLCAYIGLLWDQVRDPAWIVTGEGSWADGYVIVPTRRPIPPPTRLALQAG